MSKSLLFSRYATNNWTPGRGLFIPTYPCFNYFPTQIIFRSWIASFKIFLVSFALTAFKYCAPPLLHFQIEISNFLPEKLFTTGKKTQQGKNCAVKWLFWENILFLWCVILKVRLYLYLYLICFFICQCACFISYHFQRWIFLKVLVWTISLNYTRTLKDAQLTSCWMVQGLLHRQFIFGKQSLSLFRGNTACQQNRRCNFSHFLDMVEIGLFFFFFS